MARGKMVEVLDRGSSGDIVTIDVYPAADEQERRRREEERYRSECGPVTTRPLIEWIEPKPRVLACEAPVVSIGKNGLSFNRAAVEALKRPKRVLTGVTATGEIALKPAPEGKGYALSVSERKGKIYGAQAGRDALTRQLEEKGLKKGWYRLEYDEKLGAFIGRRIEP